jgi:hypothetical protein
VRPRPLPARHDEEPLPPPTCASDPVRRLAGWRSSGCRLHGLTGPTWDRDPRMHDRAERTALTWGRCEKHRLDREGLAVLIIRFKF